MATEEKQAEQWPQGKGRKLIRYGYRLVADGEWLLAALLEHCPQVES